MLLFRRLDPLDKIKDEDILMKAWLDCFKCHYALWCKGIRHGDISVWNLMWDSDNGCGILNDFDLAVVKGTDQYRDGRRTGTLPFMSLRILNLTAGGNELGENLYAYELESFTWVLLWLSLREEDSFTEDADCKTNLILNGDADWRFANTFTEAISTKSVFIRNHQSYDSYASFPGAWNKCKCLMALLKAVESINTDWWDYGKTGEPYLEDIYLEVVKIIEDDEYDLDDVKDFKEMLAEKLRIVYVEYSNAWKAAKAAKNSVNASVK